VTSKDEDFFDLSIDVEQVSSIFNAFARNYDNLVINSKMIFGYTIIN
jgi:hypothetical protein